MGTAGIAICGLIIVMILCCRAAGVDGYSAFLKGAEAGLKSAISLAPALTGMLVMLAVMNASGLSATVTRLLSPLMQLMHIPEEITPLIVLRPLTGSGSLAALEQILRQCGPDSRAGLMASILMGSSETIFYTMTVYLGAAGIRKLPGVVPVAITAYLAGVAACALLL